MKKYFFLGLGVGIIISGIIFWTMKPVEVVRTSEIQDSKVSEVTKVNIPVEEKEIIDVKYYIQVGAYKYYDNCLKIIDKIKDVELEIKKGNDIYRIQTKEIDNYEKALSIASLLENKYEMKVYIKEIIN